MKKRVPKSECIRKIEWDRSVFENFDFLVKVKGLLGQSIFFFFFFFFCRRFGPGPVSRSVRVKPGQTLVGGDVMDDVTALDACARVARVCSGAYGMARARA